MGFYFCGIYKYCDDKYVERVMFEVVSLFRGFDYCYGYEAWKAILKISLVISP